MCEFDRMKEIMREVAALLLRLSGLTLLVKTLWSGQRVPILVYHDPSPGVFENHARYLSKQYNFITLDQLVDAILRRDRTLLPRSPMVVTFDDGHVRNYQLLPLFRQYHVAPTIYLCSRVINTRRLFWFKGINGPSAPLKQLSHADWLQSLKERYELDITMEYPDRERQGLSYDELRAMIPDVTMGAHTMYHPILTQCTGQVSREEIAQSKKDIEALLGIRCAHFAYPNGDYTPREMRFVEEAGFTSARTSDTGWNSVNTNRFALKSILISDDTSVNMLIAQLSGIPAFLRRLRRGSWTGKKPVTPPAARSK